MSEFRHINHFQYYTSFIYYNIYFGFLEGHREKETTTMLLLALFFKWRCQYFRTVQVPTSSYFRKKFQIKIVVNQISFILYLTLNFNNVKRILRFNVFIVNIFRLKTVSFFLFIFYISTKSLLICIIHHLFLLTCA